MILWSVLNLKDQDLYLPPHPVHILSSNEFKRFALKNNCGELIQHN